MMIFISTSNRTKKNIIITLPFWALGLDMHVVQRAFQQKSGRHYGIMHKKYIYGRDVRPLRKDKNVF